VHAGAGEVHSHASHVSRKGSLGSSSPWWICNLLPRLWFLWTSGMVILSFSRKPKWDVPVVAIKPFVSNSKLCIPGAEVLSWLCTALGLKPAFGCWGSLLTVCPNLLLWLTSTTKEYWDEGATYVLLLQKGVHWCWMVLWFLCWVITSGSEFMKFFKINFFL
jgi:hypothetical protein